MGPVGGVQPQLVQIAGGGPRRTMTILYTHCRDLSTGQLATGNRAKPERAGARRAHFVTGGRPVPPLSFSGPKVPALSARAPGRARPSGLWSDCCGGHRPSVPSFEHERKHILCFRLA